MGARIIYTSPGDMLLALYSVYVPVRYPVIWIMELYGLLCSVYHALSCLAVK